MSDDSDSGLNLDPLFVGLTRPSLLFGVNPMFVILNALACIGYFVMTNDIRIMGLMGFLHIVGYLASSKEPLFVELVMVKLQKCNRCDNKFYHGSNSYDIC